MLKKGKFVFAFILLMVTGAMFGQTFGQEPLDGAWVKTTTKEKEIIPYSYVREADVFWSKRIWRVIDVREKMNLPFKYPQQPLSEIIHTAAKNGELTVYDNNTLNGDQFKLVLSVSDVKKLGERRDTVMQINPVTLEEESVIQNTEFDPGKVVKYKLKEDWFFDDCLSTMMCRIIGIAPVMEDFDASGNYRGDMTMYWVYYPDLRPILGKYEVFNPKNDAVRMSWEDIFEARYFESYIYKESNVHDRNIQEYATGIDALLESDRVKNDNFVFEHDLWNY